MFESINRIQGAKYPSSAGIQILRENKGVGRVVAVGMVLSRGNHGKRG